MNPSRARQRINALYQQLEELRPILLGRAPLLAAFLYEQNSRCGKSQCKCARGSYRHRLWCVSFLQGGKSCTRVVPPSVRSEVETLTSAYRRLRQSRRRIARMLPELLAAVDALSDARCKVGRARYEALVKKARKALRSAGRGRSSR